MPLTLTIRNAGSLDNGSPRSIVLDKRGALIGRAATSDWCLPDPSLHISSRHCEIKFVDGRYELHDISTNGTFLQGHSARLAGPHTINAGEVFVIGPFEIAAALDEAAAAAAQAASAAPPVPEWKGWAAGSGEAAAPISESAWDRRPAGAAITGSGAMSQAWTPPSASSPAASSWGAAPPPASPSAPASSSASSGWGAPASDPASQPVPTPSATASAWGAAPSSVPPASASWGAPAPAPGPAPVPENPGWGSPPPASPAPSSGWGSPSVEPPAASGWGVSTPSPAARPEASPSTWDVAAPAPVQGPSAWSSPATPPPPPSGEDIWGKFNASNVVDWARGGFGKPAAPTPAPLTPGPVPSPVPNAAPNAVSGATAPIAQVPVPAPGAPSGGGIVPLAQGLELTPERLKQGEAETLSLAGNLLRRLISGLVVMLEARARAKSQLGAQGTSLEFAGNNPLKFARTPDQALAQLLNTPERGFMGPEQAIEDAFKDLQAHQMATLAAMQGALRATLDRFSPKAIRARAESGGFLSKVLPGAKDAALWKAYEREFSGVAQGSDEAFMDVFAKEFRKAYEEAARRV